ncbi:unnamed protein product [Owenia fusiformis]|uniref:Major facilitator superfamily (MFS) profile domain-containing protein n=1 Tax=Owenia fusiformis TaxID=6347 RepID=A0A8S4N3R0_OWEFU|nr:unnamed protein product [Owenia fusiformis]
MKFDDVIELVGPFGAYQWALFFLLGLGAMPNGWQSMANNYLVGKQKHWCSIPALGNLSHSLQKHISIPLDQKQDGSFEYNSCKYYNISYENFSRDELLGWNRSVQLGGLIPVDCNNGWVYDRSLHYSTVLSKWDTVCDRQYLGPLVSTIYIGGMLVGSLLAGLVSDRFGRHKGMILFMFTEFVFALAGAFMPTYALFCVCRFGVGASTLAVYIISFVTLMENIGPKYRSKAHLSVFFASGFGILSLYAFVVRDFQKLQIVMAVPRVVFFSYIWIMPESPRWLVSQGRTEEAMIILRRMAEINGNTLPEKIDFSEDVKTDDEKDIGEMEPEQDADRSKGTIVDLFRTPNIRKRFIIMAFIWIVTSMVYYGFALNSGNLAGIVFLNTLISAMTDILAWVICINILGIIGRKIPLGVSLITGGIGCLITIPFLYRLDLKVVVTVLSLIGKLGAAASFQIIYTFTAELFPTGIRSAAMGTASMSSRVSSMAAAQIGQLDKVFLPLPSIIFGTCSLVAGLLAFLLPETLNQMLPQTIADGELFGTKQYNKIKEDTMDKNEKEREMDKEHIKSAENGKMHIENGGETNHAFQHETLSVNKSQTFDQTCL